MKFDVKRCKTIAMQMQGFHCKKKEKWNAENLLGEAEKTCGPDAPIEAVNRTRPSETSREPTSVTRKTKSQHGKRCPMQHWTRKVLASKGPTAQRARELTRGPPPPK